MNTTDLYTADVYMHLSFDEQKERRALYILNRTSYLDLVATCYTFRINMGYINKDLLLVTLQYLPDRHVDRVKERLVHIYTRRTLMFYWAKESVDENPRYGWNSTFNGNLVRYRFKPQWYSKKRAMAMITNYYGKAVLAGASETELEEWHRLLQILDQGLAKSITWFKLWDHTYELVLDGDRGGDIAETFIMYFRPT